MGICAEVLSDDPVLGLHFVGILHLFGILRLFGCRLETNLLSVMSDSLAVYRQHVIQII